jgi:hypothetical protein
MGAEPRHVPSTEGDAEGARQFTVSLDDASPARVAAFAALLVNPWHADVDRLAGRQGTPTQARAGPPASTIRM